MATQELQHLDRGEKKLLLSIIRDKLLEAVSRLREVDMEKIIGNTEQLALFKEGVLKEVHRHIADHNLEGLKTEVDWSEKGLKWIDTFIGAVVTAYEQSAKKCEGISMKSLGMWDTFWNLAKARNKCVAKELRVVGYANNKASLAFAKTETTDHGVANKSTDGLLKMIQSCTYQEGGLTGMIYVDCGVIHTDECIGVGAYGRAYKVRMKGVPGLLDLVTYVGKSYLGSDGQQVMQARREYTMQIVHPVLVRIIAGTREMPLWSIMPYFNGGTLHKLLKMLPYHLGSYTMFVDKANGGIGERVHKRFKGEPSVHKDLTPSDKVKIVLFCKCLPNCIHALVRGMKRLHEGRWMHNDLHANNIVLDWTSQACRIGIIDWGMALDVTESRPAFKRIKKEENETEADWQRRLSHAVNRMNVRQWKAPELRDPTKKVYCTREHDVYALGWIITKMCDFFADATYLFHDTRSMPNQDHIRAIRKWVGSNMLCGEPSVRYSFDQVNSFLDKLGFHPEDAMRPLHEMGLTLKNVA